MNNISADANKGALLPRLSKKLLTGFTVVAGALLDTLTGSCFTWSVLTGSGFFFAATIISFVFR